MENVLIADSSKLNTLFPANEIKLVGIGDKKICIVRIGNNFFAFEAFCPHMDHPLSNGIVNNFNQIVCSWHNYVFDLRNGKEQQLRCRNLKRYNTIINEKGLWVEIE